MLLIVAAFVNTACINATIYNGLVNAMIPRPVQLPTGGRKQHNTYSHDISANGPAKKENLSRSVSRIQLTCHSTLYNRHAEKADHMQRVQPMINNCTAPSTMRGSWLQKANLAAIAELLHRFGNMATPCSTPKHHHTFLNHRKEGMDNVGQEFSKCMSIPSQISSWCGLTATDTLQAGCAWQMFAINALEDEKFLPQDHNSCAAPVKAVPQKHKSTIWQ